MYVNEALSAKVVVSQGLGYPRASGANGAHDRSGRSRPGTRFPRM